MSFLTRLLILLLSSLGILVSSQESYAVSPPVLHLTRLNQPLEEEWNHHKYVKETLYSLVNEDGKPSIQAVGQQSASGLYKEANYSLMEYPWLEWSWKLKTVHKTANLRIKEKEDMALGVFLIFPHSWTPWKTKVLAYVWASENHRPGEIVMRSYAHYPFIVLKAGAEKTGQWISERRNVYEDYKRIYGEYPKQNVEAIALFTDNDQTHEPVVGYYGAIKALK